MDKQVQNKSSIFVLYFFFIVCYNQEIKKESTDGSF